MKAHRLEIGCGEELDRENTVGIDKNVEGENILQLDLEEVDELPFEDNRFTYVKAEHVLEHLSMQAFKRTMAEIARVTKEGGWVDITGPHYLCWNSPAGDHYRGFSQQSFECFCIGHDYPTSFPQRYSLKERSYTWRENPVVRFCRTFLPDDIVRQHVPNAVEEIKFRLVVEEKFKWRN